MTNTVEELTAPSMKKFGLLAEFQKRTSENGPGGCVGFTKLSR